MTGRSGVLAPPSALVLRRLQGLCPLAPAAAELVSSMRDLRSHGTGSELLAERDEISSARYIASGWAARVRWLADGRRQIINFLVPGDGLGICFRPNPLTICTVIALSPVQTLDAEPVQAALRSGDPQWESLATAAHLSASLEEAWLINQVVRLGRHSAYERLSNLFLELHYRLSQVGLVNDWEFRSPLTQDVLADATGLSVVHVNRTVQHLRREHLFDMRSGRVIIKQPELMRALAEFEPPRVRSEARNGGGR